MLYFIASLKPTRRRSLRFANEQAFLREWLAPVTLETLALAMQGGPPGQDALMVLLILVERMNGLRSGV